VVLGQGSTGAANDLAGATDLATKMVREFGLSKTLGPVGYPEGGSVFLGGGGPGMSSRPFAEATQAEIDREVSRLLRQAEERAVATAQGPPPRARRAGQPAARAGNGGRNRRLPAGRPARTARRRTAGTADPDHRVAPRRGQRQRRRC
jgi:hypothetical protein